MAHPLVVHCKRARHDVYCGRPSMFGNPFVIGKDGTRDEVIDKYIAWAPKQPYLMEAIKGLRGKVLGCYCSPLRCHCDWIAEIANAPESLPPAET